MSTRKRAKSHKDVEFHVPDTTGHTKVFKTWAEAVVFDVGVSLSGRGTEVDVVVYSKAGARWFEGEYGVEQYNEDPEATVYKRVRITADDLGRIA